MNAGITEEESLAAFTSAAMRGPRFSIFHQIQSQTLIKANRIGDPVKKIFLICEASFRSRVKEKIDMELVDSCFSVAQSFLNTEIKANADIISVAWNFRETKENYEKNIAAWQKLGISFHPLYTPYRRRNYVSKPLFESHVTASDREWQWEEAQKVRKEILEAFQKMPPHENFFERCNAIARGSFYSLKGEFSQWALSRLMEVENIIMNEVDPTIYRDTLSLMVGKTEETEE